ncbi:MAG: hypothetical protein JWO22_3317, partial [Frankiales bacterium]|nr:hypothetical protein [Frankiales bacterium]
MHARSRDVRLAGVALSTPLLVPSVSSKGFPRDKEGVPESNFLVNQARDDLNESLLISAYDLHGNHLEGAGIFLEGGRTALFDMPQLLVIDSGGYETGPDWESGQADREDRGVDRAYNQDGYVSILDRLPDRPVLAVSYDGPDIDPESYEAQIDRARRLFDRRGVASDMLLKPERPGAFHSPRALTDAAPNLARFDVIGFTEKELGNSLVARLTTLAKLRTVLDGAGITAPIHVFGAL